MRDTITDIEALTRLRAERGMTMAALARAAGVSYSMVKYVHYGERQFSHVTAAAIARALGCDP
ncbi:MAG TPA: helix-turn-helix transcriptional regulator, partial [Pseudonocardia sp.]|nr:helix-turn-helix transcriptional regulator [Pseudonocardia sp.]